MLRWASGDGPGQTQAVDPPLWSRLKESELFNGLPLIVVQTPMLYKIINPNNFDDALTFSLATPLRVFFLICILWDSDSRKMTGLRGCNKRSVKGNYMQLLSLVELEPGVSTSFTCREILYTRHLCSTIIYFLLPRWHRSYRETRCCESDSSQTNGRRRVG